MCEGTKGLRRKVWTRTKILSPNMRYFVATLRFVSILALFGRLWAKKCFLGSKTVFLGQEVHYYIVYIAYFTELKLQMCDYAQKRHICREKCKYALDENFYGHFCPRRKVAKFCHPASDTVIDIVDIIHNRRCCTFFMHKERVILALLV